MAGSDENIRLQGMVHRLERALERAITEKTAAEEEVGALRRLVGVLEETAAKAPCHSSPPAPETHLLAEMTAKMAQSIARMESISQQQASEEKISHDATVAALQADLLALRGSLREAENDRDRHATAHETSVVQLKEVQKEALAYSVEVKSASSKVQQLESKLDEAQASLQASQRKLGEATTTLEFTKLAAADASAATTTEVSRLEAALQGAVREVSMRREEILRLDETIATQAEEAKQLKDQLETLKNEAAKDCSGSPERKRKI